MNFIGGALHFLKKRTIPLILQMSQRDFHHHWVGHSLLSADPLRPTIRERRHQRPSPVSPPATWPAHTTTHVILTGRIAAGAAAAARLAREGGDRWPQGRVLLVDSWVSAEPTASARLGLTRKIARYAAPVSNAYYMGRWFLLFGLKKVGFSPVQS